MIKEIFKICLGLVPLFVLAAAFHFFDPQAAGKIAVLVGLIAFSIYIFAPHKGKDKVNDLDSDLGRS